MMVQDFPQKSTRRASRLSTRSKVAIWVASAAASVVGLHGFVPSMVLQQQNQDNVFTLPSTTASWCFAQSNDDDRDYLAELNEPILVVTAASKSYEKYFEAWSSLDMLSANAPYLKDVLIFGTPAFENALVWAGEDEQQAVFDSLLAEDGNNVNVAYRQLFGLPYGMRDISDDMDAEGFAVYINNERLDDPDFAYFEAVNQLWLALLAESYRRASDDNASGSVDSLMTAIRIGRQMCDRGYYPEARRGMQMIEDTLMVTREIMWRYRTAFSAEDYKAIADSLESLYMAKIKPPRAHELAGQQIVNLIFNLENWRPDQQVFSQTMARFESRDNPLNMFSATAKWRDLMAQHATYNETVAELEMCAGDIRLRWRFAFNDPQFFRDPRVKQLAPTKYAIPRAVYTEIDQLREQRLAIRLRQHGIMVAAGVAARQTKEGGELIPGQPATGAPLSFGQVQPQYVELEEFLADPMSTGGDKLHYYIVTNREAERTRTTVLKRFNIRTPYGSVELVEGWPVLYSIGYDESDDHGAIFGIGKRDKGDFIFWPPVEIMAKE